MTRAADVSLAAELGADAVGFVLEPSSPRFIDVDTARQLAVLAGPYCTAVGVFGRSIGAVPGFGATQAVEFGTRPAGTMIQTVRLRPGDTVESALKTASGADAIHLDAYSPAGYGGTGETIDWELAAEVVRSSSVPVILSGGLTPENVASAIRRVLPYAVDVSSGVESSPGLKDPAKVAAFIEAAKGAR